MDTLRSILTWAATSIFAILLAGFVIALTENYKELLKQRGGNQLLVKLLDALPKKLLDNFRWKLLRGLCWLWAIFGLSGGVAVALWVTPLIVRPQPDENPPEVVSLRAQLDATTKELEREKHAASGSKPAVPPVQVYLAGVGTIEVPYVRNMGPLNTLNRFSLAKDIEKKLEGQDIAFIITAPRENFLVKYDVEMILSVGGYIKIVQPPNYAVAIDAPRLTDSGYSGVIVHGHSDAQELIDNLLRDCFITRQATKSIEGLAQYYKITNVVWIEIGKGSPWKSPSACWD